MCKKIISALVIDFSLVMHLFNDLVYLVGVYCGGVCCEFLVRGRIVKLTQGFRDVIHSVEYNYPIAFVGRFDCYVFELPDLFDGC